MGYDHFGVGSGPAHYSVTLKRNHLPTAVADNCAMPNEHRASTMYAFLVILPPLRKMLRLLLLAFFGIRFASSAASVSRVTRFSSGLHTTRGVDFHD